MEDTNVKKSYVCAQCGSKAEGKAGTCCGEERKEDKKEQKADAKNK